MAFWNPNEIISVNDGVTPDDGTGDSIRDAFIKVNNNFSNVSIQLGQPNQNWLNANVEVQLDTNYLNAANVFLANVITANVVSGNLSVDHLTVNTTNYVNGKSYFYDTINVSTDIVPGADAVYNLGSPTRRFANLYVQQTVSTTQINQSSDSSILVIHANSAGDSDVGILGNVTDKDIDDDVGENSYAFFGYQLASDNFVYKITPTNPTLGNSIVYDGYYGGAQFGTLILSNSTAATNTTTGALRVAGGAGVVGNLWVGATANAAAMYSGGYQVLTTNSPGLTNYSGTTIANLVITGANVSTSTSTGALILSYGGAGIAGNVVAGGFVGPYYGTIQTAAQPNITSVGTLSQLQVATSIGAAGIAVSGSISSGTISATGGATITGNLFNVGSTTSTGTVTATSFVGDGSGLTGIPTTTQFNILNANVGAFEITTNANIGGHQIAIASINANLGAYQIWSNANVGTLSTTVATQTSQIATLNANLGTATNNITTLFSNAASQATSLNTINANLGTATNNITTLFSNAASQATSINTLTNSNITVNGTAITLGSSGTVTAAAGTLTGSTLASGVTASSLTSVGTLSGLTVSGAILPTTNGTINIGSAVNKFATIYGVSTSAQYADLAENYIADAVYEPGTVVVFGGDAEITVTAEFADTRVAGAISTNPAYLMNSEAGGLAVALRGRVPCKVVGPVTKGDLLVTSTTPGHAQSVGNDKQYGPAVFAKSLDTDLADGEKTITAVIL